MKTIRCYAIDDDNGFLLMLKQYVDKTARLKWEGCTTDPKKGLREILTRKNGVDLLFLDVQMEPMSGLEVMLQLPKQLHVILCTSYRKFACDAFDLRALDFLLKPVPFDRFLGAISLVEAAMQLEPSITSYVQDYDFFFVRSGNKSSKVMVRFDEITHIEADGEVSHIHLFDVSTLTISKRIGVLHKRLPRDRFERVHNSYVINKKYVHETGNGMVLLKTKDGTLTIPLGGRNFARDFHNWVDSHSLT